MRRAQDIEALLQQLRRRPLDDRRAQLLAALIKVTLRQRDQQKTGRNARLLH